MPDPVPTQATRRVTRNTHLCKLGDDHWQYRKEYVTRILLTIARVLAVAYLVTFLSQVADRSLLTFLAVMLIAPIMALYALLPLVRFVEIDRSAGRVILVWRHHLGIQRGKEYDLSRFDTVLLSKRLVSGERRSHLRFSVCLQGASAQCTIVSVTHSVTRAFVEHARELAASLGVDFVDEAEPSDYHEPCPNDISDVWEHFHVDDGIKEILARSLRYLDPIGLYAGPKIRQDRLESAVSSYAREYRAEEVPLILMDPPAFGTSKEGLLVSRRVLYGWDPDTGEPTSVKLADLSHLSIDRDRDSQHVLCARGRRLVRVRGPDDKVEVLARILEMIAHYLRTGSSREDDLPQAVRTHEKRFRDDRVIFHPFILDSALTELTGTLTVRPAPGERPIALVNDTASGKVNRGCLITDQGIYSNKFEPLRKTEDPPAEVVRFSQFGSVHLRRAGLVSQIVFADVDLGISFYMVKRASLELLAEMLQALAEEYRRKSGPGAASASSPSWSWSTGHSRERARRVV